MGDPLAILRNYGKYEAFGGAGVTTPAAGEACPPFSANKFSVPGFFTGTKRRFSRCGNRQNSDMTACLIEIAAARG